MTIQEIRTKYLNERGESYFNKFNTNDYTMFLEKELQEIKVLNSISSPKKIIMTYTAKVSYNFHPYMDHEVKEESKYHTIEATSEFEAERKINTHYSRKGDDHGDGYSVTEVEFFEHIN